MPSEENWPLDPQGYIFLLRAVEQVGREQHGDNWTQKARLPVLPTSIDLNEIDSDARMKSETLKAILTRPDLASRLPTFKLFHDAVQQAAQLAQQEVFRAKSAQARAAAVSISSRWRAGSFEPAKKKVVAPKVAIDPSLAEICRWTLKGITKAQWLEAARLVSSESVAMRTAHQNLKAVSLRMIKACEAGELRSSLRLPDGRMTDIPRHHWNGENLWPRFIDGSYDPADPFQARKGPRQQLFIFLLLDSFSAWLPASRKKKAVRVGPPEKYDWEEAKLFMLRELEARGDFLDPQNNVPGWKSQNNLVDLIIEHLEKRPDVGDDNGPSPSAVKNKVKGWLKEWRTGQ
ncbi:hypothetical protein IVB34_40120 [Bradyrhizobium sp. 2]|uniref:hypothetical protein n=1 Tax=unclassified Bradyrhizobium TaxID=2631580 RepID=UPI001FFA8224|nr:MULTISPECIES: hypothetical protein [unclassified Bradyrhizobium]MCK1447235.1 hypothetical protein [Bradyrhizobium sp. 48]MCK1464398.1 hypothetical protein [Bradyrhizobium sp. 2]